MDDLSDNLGAWHKGKIDGPVKSRAVASCGTPRHHWRSMSWCNSSRVADETSAAGNSDGGMEKSNHEDKISSSSNVDSQTINMQLLCLPLQSLSVSKQKGSSLPSASSPSSSSASKERSKLIAKIRNGVDTKIDLVAVEKTCQDLYDSDGGDELRARLAEYDKECSHVLPFLCIGGKTVAQSLTTLHGCRVTHILNCVGFVCPEYFPNDFFYKTLWLQDSPSEDIICVLYDVFDYIEDVREQAGGRVLVHCCQGVSRSAALVIAYLMWRDRQCFEDAFEQVKERRGIVSPNMGFVFQLIQWQSRILNGPEGQCFRMYRMCPHSAYDPLHLVPKAVSNPGMKALDSRGAFIIQLPTGLYIWRGNSCDKEMAAAADWAAFQLVRYEHAQGPIISFLEGNEPGPLQEALRKEISQVMEGSNEDATSVKTAISKDELGERHVAAYDMDFEMCRKAKLGGYVPPVIGSGAIIHLPAKDEKWSRLRTCSLKKVD